MCQIDTKGANKMNVQKFFDTLAELYGKKNNVKITYTLTKRDSERA